MKPPILIAGIGNIFLGDDAFGVEVVREMLGRKMSPEVRIVDFGIRGLDLTYALLDDYEAAILVDAVPRGQPPGTVYLIEPETGDPAVCEDASQNDLLIETHGMHPAKVLRLVAGMGGKTRQVLVVGCEPTPFDSERDMDMNLSPAVRAAIPEAIKLIESLVEKILNGEDRPLVHETKGVCDVITPGADVGGFAI
jgi:hydrogenase maturation protease